MRSSEPARSPTPLRRPSRRRQGDGPTPAHVRQNPDAVAWPSYGIVSGVLGAAVVAVVLLFVDLSDGRPLWTPAVLGSVLFTGEGLVPAEFDPRSHLALVAGYSAIHGVIFVGFGACAAFFLMTAQHLMRSEAAVAALAAGVLFVLFEGTFLAYALVFEPRLTLDLAWGWVAVANACAAGAMGVFLARNAGPRAPRAPENLPKP